MQAQIIEWIQQHPSRSKFRVYRINAFHYGIPTTRVRCILTNFSIDGEDDLACGDQRTLAAGSSAEAFNDTDDEVLPDAPPLAARAPPLDESLLRPLRALGPSKFAEGQGYALACGDCLAVLQTLPDKSVDLICSDPPYGNGYQHEGDASKDYADKKFLDDKWRTLIKEGWRVLKQGGHQVLFANKTFKDQLLRIILEFTACEGAKYDYRELTWVRGPNSQQAVNRFTRSEAPSDESIFKLFRREGVMTPGLSIYTRPKVRMRSLESHECSPS